VPKLLQSPFYSIFSSPLQHPLVGQWGGGRYDQSLFANGESGFIHDFSRKDLLFQLSNGTTLVATDNDPIGWAKSLDPTQRISTQATTSARPFWKTPNFARFDGADDNLPTTFAPTAAATLAFKGKITNTLSVIIGTGSAGQFFYVGPNASGNLAAGAGTTASWGHASTQPIQNVKGVGVVTCDGSTVKLFWNGVQCYSGTLSGTINTAFAIIVGAFNNAGAPQVFAAGDLYNALAINRALTPAEALNLSNNWNAS
jgi:hypothetical protein